MNKTIQRRRKPTPARKKTSQRTPRLNILAPTQKDVEALIKLAQKITPPDECPPQQDNN